MRIACAALGAGIALAMGAAAAAPHEHGLGTLEVAVDARALTITLRLPAQDVVGFERAPRNDAERGRIAQARAALGDAKLFAPNAEARCAPQGAPAVESPRFASTAKDEHVDFEATYRFECANAAALTGLDHGVFAAFPKITRLKAQIASARGQKQATLTPAKPRLAL